MKIETQIEIIRESCGKNRAQSIRELQALLDEMSAELGRELHELLDEITPSNIDSKTVCKEMMTDLLSSCVDQRPHTSTVARLYALINQHYSEEVN